MRLRGIGLALGFLAGTSVALAQPVTVTYVANEGILISGDSVRVLIDGLHRPYRPEYLSLSDDLQAAAETGQAPFDGIDLLLVSHNHRDHFSPAAVGAYLAAVPGARLWSSPQIIGAACDDGCELVWPGFGRADSVVLDRVSVTFLGLRHVNERHRSVQNLGHVVEVGGRRILHVGDAELSESNFASFDLPGRGIDVALLPAWYLLSSADRALVDRLIGARRVIAVHVDPSDGERVDRLMQETFPAGRAFFRSMEDTVRVR